MTPKKIRAWQYALIGIALQWIFLFAIGEFASTWLFLRAATTLALVPVAMLAFEKTLPLGGVVGFLVGLAFAVTQVVSVMGLALIIASVYAIVAETPWGPGPGPVGADSDDEPDSDDRA